MITVREEVMNEFFRKAFIDGVVPNETLIYHIFSGPENGDFHDHPFDIQIRVVHGGYAEEVLGQDGYIRKENHVAGDQFTIKAEHIHRIVAMTSDGCVTEVKYGPKTQEPGFWRVDEDGIWIRRQWNEEEWKRVS